MRSASGFWPRAWHRRKPHLFPFIVALMSLGARAGELHALRWTELDLEAGIARLLKTKSGNRGRFRVTRSICSRGSRVHLASIGNRPVASADLLGRVAMNWATAGLEGVAVALRSGAVTLERVVVSVRDVRLRSRLAKLDGFAFEYDYTTSHDALWRDCLRPFAAQPDVHLLEVGVFEGRSSVWFLQNVFTHPTSTLTCIDSFERAEDEARFDHNVRASGAAPRVTKLKGQSVAVLPSLAGRTFDVIYVDGSHEATDVLMDAVLCWQLLRSGGVMIFDDYVWESLHRRQIDQEIGSLHREVAVRRAA
jgi:precorrin-6B methylase 2